MKRVYAFEDGCAEMKEQLGGKGANLAEMTRLGFPVPPGFTISTDACRMYWQAGVLPQDLMDEVEEALVELQRKTGKSLGDSQRPLLVSVRSGSVTSMPGMMDTILNLGLNDETVEGLARETGDARFAHDCYRRLIQMFGDVVYGMERHPFEQLLVKAKRNYDCHNDKDLPVDALKTLVHQYQNLLAKEGHPFPQDTGIQLQLAIRAVFQSWNNERAKVYRRVHNIPDEQGTAVNIQIMVFGNKGEDCGTGVVFSRNPSTGERKLYGEYLPNAQGEDVVAGSRTPLSVEVWKELDPALHDKMSEIAAQLEAHYGDMQDIEFTVEHGTIYLLQTRLGKRTAQAAVRIAADLCKEGVIDKRQALARMEPGHLEQLLHRSLEPGQHNLKLASGLAASPGAAVGRAVFDADQAQACSEKGEAVILIRPETTPEDIHGVLAAEGLLTARGGMTSHAAVVARGMGKPCICGCESLDIQYREFWAGDTLVREGDWISLDGTAGIVYGGRAALSEPDLSEELKEMLSWADEIRALRVFANADTPEDARKAREYGAEGIGLCRTEHMFFAPDRLLLMQQMILSDDEAERRVLLGKLAVFQQADFTALLESMEGLPVSIRLLDPPLHEFLPGEEDLRKTFAAGAQRERQLAKVRSMREVNPMLGLRGCRLGLLHPEIYDMQIEAVFRAYADCRERGLSVHPEIMVPLVGEARELQRIRARTEVLAAQVLGEPLAATPIRIGTMIEVPRAALTADEIAAEADFFSFGTNDLTQLTYGYSRDDAENKFLAFYLESRILSVNPFVELDAKAVAPLIRTAVERGRTIQPKLRTGVCGEHGGNPASIRLCRTLGLDYVSCSPYRVPIARLAAAQAELANTKQNV